MENCFTMRVVKCWNWEQSDLPDKLLNDLM